MRHPACDPRGITCDVSTPRTSTGRRRSWRRIVIPGRFSGTYSKAGCFFELEGEEPREIVAGEAFWEPGGDVVHYQVANLDPDNWSRLFAVCICAPDVDMITMLEHSEEIVARDHRRHPAARQYAK